MGKLKDEVPLRGPNVGQLIRTLLHYKVPASKASLEGVRASMKDPRTMISVLFRMRFIAEDGTLTEEGRNLVSAYRSRKYEMVRHLIDRRYNGLRG